MGVILLNGVSTVCYSFPYLRRCTVFQGRGKSQAKNKGRFQKNRENKQAGSSITFQSFNLTMESSAPKETTAEKTTTQTKPDITPSSFFINIKSINSDGTIDGMQDIRIEVKRTDLIAAVKQKYIDSGRCKYPDYIVLQFNGKELSDNTTVMENDLFADCTVFHQYSNVKPFSKVDYGKLAKQIHEQALKDKDYHHAGFDPVLGTWDQQWEKGDEWESYPTVMVPDQEELNKNAAIVPKKAPSFNPLDTSEYPNRVFKNMFVSVVGGFIFEVMHRMEGKWSGLSAVPVGVSLVDGDEMEEEDDAPVTTCDLRFDSHGYWVERRSNVDPTGLVSTRTIRYTPIGNGKLRVEMSDGMYAECKVEMVEMSPYLLITTAVNAHTGKPVLVESVTILDNTRRVRTIQDFSSVGNMTDVYVINEKRVLDPSAQSIAPYEMLHTKTESI